MSSRSRCVGIRALLVCAGATALIVVGAGPVIGEDEDLSRARAACESRGTDAAKLEGMRALVAIDSAASRRTLEGYAQGRDRRLAAAAIATIGRADYAGARGRLREIFEDEDLPHVSRALAFAAWARLEIASGSSWSAIESYGREHCEAGSALLDSVLAAKNALAPGTTGGR